MGKTREISLHFRKSDAQLLQEWRDDHRVIWAITIDNQKLLLSFNTECQNVPDLDRAERDWLWGDRLDDSWDRAKLKGVEQYEIHINDNQRADKYLPERCESVWKSCVPKLMDSHPSFTEYSWRFTRRIDDPD